MRFCNAGFRLFDKMHFARGSAVIFSFHFLRRKRRSTLFEFKYDVRRSKLKCIRTCSNRFRLFFRFVAPSRHPHSNNAFETTPSPQVSKHESKILEPMSIVMVISMEMKVSGQLLTVVWRAIHDGELASALDKLDNAYRRIDAAGASLHPAAVLLVVAGVCGHFVVHMIRSLDIAFNVPNLRFVERVSLVRPNQCFSTFFNSPPPRVAIHFLTTPTM